MLRIDPQCTVGAHLCLLKIFWTFAQRWFYIFYLSICILLFYISYIFVSFHHWSELIFASWSSFWSSSQLLHSTDGIALSTQWHVSITYNLCFFYWNICFPHLVMVYCIFLQEVMRFYGKNLKPQNVWVEKWQTKVMPKMWFVRCEIYVLSCKIG